MLALSIPSPGEGVWHLGPLPIRGYALCIILGIVAAIVIGEKRWQARGGKYGEIQDIAIWAVPFGLVGGRLYHVATDSACYFDRVSCEAHGNLYRGFWGVFEVWRGGLGIWGAIALGALGAYIGARRKGVRFTALADTLAPGLLVAQAIGRWGNWFNQELYGKPTDLPWGLEIDRSHWPDHCDHPYQGMSCGFAPGTTFHPTFLYECLWNLAAFALLIWLERRYRLGYGRVTAVYVMLYTLGRGWIEYLRIDDVQLENVLGLRFNDWTSIVLFVAAALFFWRSQRRHPGREPSVYVEGREPAHTSTEEPAADGSADAAADAGAEPRPGPVEESTSDRE